MFWAGTDYEICTSIKKEKREGPEADRRTEWGSEISEENEKNEVGEAKDKQEL